MTLLIASPDEPDGPDQPDSAASSAPSHKTSAAAAPQLNTWATLSAPVLCVVMKTFMTYANPPARSEKDSSQNSNPREQFCIFIAALTPPPPHT